MIQIDVVRLRRHQTAQGKHRQAADDHRLTPDAVGEHAGGDLEQGLGQAVDSHRQTYQQRGDAVQSFGVESEYRQDQKQSEHAQGIDRRQ